MKYHQLTQRQRYQLEQYLSLGFSKGEISIKLGVHRSTIYREIKRNSLSVIWEPKPQYDGVAANGQAVARRHESGIDRRKIKGELLESIVKGLDLKLSPEQIAGRLKLESKCKVSYSSIYRHIWRDASDWYESRGLFKKLRRNIRKRGRKRKQRPDPVGMGSPRLSIRERPLAADQRQEIGHMERDLMEGRRGGKVLNVLVDRKSRYTILDLVSRDGKVVHRSTIRIKNRKIHKNKIKTITNDNGHEFIYSRLERAKRTLGLDVFFTDPGSPWQRGTVENTIGLIRQFLPKKTDLSGIKKAQIRAIEKILNGRPRKILNYYTPAEILTSKPGKKPRIKTFLFS